MILGDFRERTRRPAYFAALAATIGLGWLAVPPLDSHWVVLNLGEVRGIYNSDYVGTVTALAGALWLFVAGFYVVRNGVTRDEISGVGELLAATPVSSIRYHMMKFISNLLVLSSMTGVLALTALALQLIRGESRAVDPMALLLPFVLITLPMVAVTAAAALIFDTVRPLRAGLGNIVWFFLALCCGIAGQGWGLGMDAIAATVPEATDIGLGFMYIDDPLRTVEWSGPAFTASFVLQRVFLLGAGVALAALPVWWFGRFDPARRSHP